MSAPASAPYQKPGDARPASEHPTTTHHAATRKPLVVIPNLTGTRVGATTGRSEGGLGSRRFRELVIVYDKPVPGRPMVRRVPAVPMVVLNPRGPSVSDVLRLPKFQRSPGARRMLRRNRHPMT